MRPLYFFNANVVRTRILAQKEMEPSPRAMLLDLGATADLDIGTSDMLCELASDLRQDNIDLLLAQVRGSVCQRMRLAGLFGHFGENCMFSSGAVAVGAFEARALETSDVGARDSRTALSTGGS